MTVWKRTSAALAAITVAFTAVPATAEVDIPLPDNAYITYGGLEWAWAAPLPIGSVPNLLSYQGTLGWRLPTADELASAPTAFDFLFPGGNVAFSASDPVSGSFFSATNSAYTSAQSAGACAAGYFNSNYTWCDWQDGNGQPQAPWAGTPGASGFADQLVVRDAAAAVPEPAAWSMMIAGFGLVGGALRRRKKTRVTFA